jgi:hypothetical protein
MTARPVSGGVDTGLGAREGEGDNVRGVWDSGKGLLFRDATSGNELVDRVGLTWPKAARAFFLMPPFNSLNFSRRDIDWRGKCVKVQRSCDDWCRYGVWSPSG